MQSSKGMYCPLPPPTGPEYYNQNMITYLRSKESQHGTGEGANNSHHVTVLEPIMKYRFSLIQVPATWLVSFSCLQLSQHAVGVTVVHSSRLGQL